MHKYITVAYDLFAADSEGKQELLEKAPAEHPFQFISELGMALEAFESHIAPLNEGDKFDFTLSVDEGYGPYDEQRVVEVPKEIFSPGGKFLKDEIYPGNVIPLVNEDGFHFYGLVVEIKEKSVIIDLNNLYAGRELRYVGHVVTSREATDAEVTNAINEMAGTSGCGGCGGHCGGDCDGDCGNHDADHECCGGGCGHCKH